MNPLKTKQYNRLEDEGNKDIADKVNEIVDWINMQNLDVRLEELVDPDETLDKIEMKAEIFSYIDDLKWDGRLSFCQFIDNLKSFIKKL